MELVERKVCISCGEEKGRGEFRANKRLLDGIENKCIGCKKGVIGGRGTSMVRVKQIAEVLFENPRATHEEISKRVGISASMVNQYICHEDMLKMMRVGGRARLGRMVPKAVRAMEASLDADDSQVRFRASKAVLEDQGIMGPERVAIGIMDLSGMSREKKMAIIRDAKLIPDQMVEEAEIIE